MSEPELRLPADFAGYAWEVESKGWFGLAEIVSDGRLYRPEFMTPTRLAAEVADTLALGEACHYVANLVVVEVVDEPHLRAAARRLAELGFDGLTWEPAPAPTGE